MFKQFFALLATWISAVVVSTLVGSLYTVCLFFNAGGARNRAVVATEDFRDLWLLVASSFALGSAVVGAVSIVVIAAFIAVNARVNFGNSFQVFCFKGSVIGVLSSLSAVALSLMLRVPTPALLFLFEILAGAAGGCVGGGVYYVVRKRTMGA